LQLPAVVIALPCLLSFSKNGDRHLEDSEPVPIL
jgi:hypothetical protein